jgi:hypothetical protein
VILAVTQAQHWWALASLAALAVDRDHRRAWARANAVLAAAWAAAKLFGRTVRRPRPNLDDCRPARTTDRESFPSTPLRRRPTRSSALRSPAAYVALAQHHGAAAGDRR